MPTTLMPTTLMYAAFGLLVLLLMVRHIRRMNRKEAAARAAAERGKLRSDGPRAQHPHIDATHCIGCGACVDVCPEGDVLAVIGGKAAIVNGHKCIGHGLCAEACPVGAITIVMASPSVSADTPQRTPQYETNVSNLFIAGELGGLALIKNAVNEGRNCVDTIAGRLFGMKRGRSVAGVVDVCIVGAGPAGISASLRAIEKKLSYVTLEQDEFGGTVAKYPRQKIVMTSPVEFPIYGKFNKLQISKEEIIKFWQKVHGRAGLHVNTREKVEQIRKEPDGSFTVETTKGRYRAWTVVLALGRRGTPRKLDVPGEELPKVMYGLIEAEAYTDAKILVVGGGDSAVEAAMGLAHQRGNRVTLSYRRESFSRIKERNVQRLPEYTKGGRLQVIFNSQPVEIGERVVRLDVAGTVREIPNDYVWVFAGGTPPSDFLKAIGVQVGPKDLTAEAGAEAKLVSGSRRLAG
ncbi:MAG TPA: NAD(P)-binding domain-containing protein [Gemmatimonadales bacterium]|nr:NAD(P)-binding domain-containing protein [Gemmatimonadales bacterium]